VLNVLADQGLQVGVLHTILQLARHYYQSGGSSGGWLEIANFPQGNPGVFLHDDVPKDDAPKVHPGAELSITLNLNQIFKGAHHEHS
jgi:hypothetical protein